jgi:hypothetical protein
MAVKVQVSEEIERPVPVVFRFYADEHVRNHPRWDPNIELWLDQDSPIGVGPIIRRRNRRSGTPVEGTMEVVEFERDNAIGALMHDGPLEIRGRATFEERGPGLTKLILTADIPDMDDSMQGPLTEAMRQSLRNMKQLIEAET